MGFMDLCVLGGDTSSDAFWLMQNAMAEALTESLKYKHNEWNTPGWMNVAMIFDEAIIDNDLYGNEKLVKVAKNTLKKLKKFKEAHGDKTVTKEVRKTVNRLEKRLTKWIEKRTTKNGEAQI